MKRYGLDMMVGLCFAVMCGLAGCGGGGGSATPPTKDTNSAPVAKAGTAQSVVTGTLVTLDGSSSSDADGDQLTYSWTLTTKPAGSSAALSSTTAAKPTFIPDVAGTYAFNLVVNDGKVYSNVATVTVTSSDGNAAPLAVAGSDQTVAINSIVTLDGSGSSDADGDQLTYNWAFTSKPPGSTAALSSATAVKPTFTADLAGSYELSLVVNDGKANSTAATVTVNALAAYLTIYGNTSSNLSTTCSALSGSQTISGFTWTFNGCRVYGPTGNKLSYSLLNPSTNTYTVTSIEVQYPGITLGNYGSYTLQPNSSLSGDVPLPYALGEVEVTNATVSFSVVNVGNIVGHFSLDRNP